MILITIFKRCLSHISHRHRICKNSFRADFPRVPSLFSTFYSVEHRKKLFFSCCYFRVPVVLSLEMPLHRRGDFGGKHLMKVTAHHFSHASVTGSQIQHPLPFPLRLDPEKTLKLLLREHKHGAAAQKAADRQDRTGQDRRP